jgi:hypothetical protein
MIIQDLIKLASKAPSGHNSQPWRFKIQDVGIEIHPDFRFSLPVVDPNFRELYISLGCAAENIRVAANHDSIRAVRSVETDANGVKYISIRLVEKEVKHGGVSIETITNRQSNRSLYNHKIIDEEVISNLKQVRLESNIQSYFFGKGSQEFSTITDFIKRGNEIQMNDPKFKEELLSWIRFNKKDIEKSNSGLTYEVMGSPPMPKLLGKMVVKSFLRPGKQNRTDEDKINSSSHFVVLTSRNNTLEEWISLGYSLERLLLKMTDLGIANAYLNPPCEIPSLAA